MSHFVKWAEKLPENFAELDFDAQFTIIDKLVNEAGYSPFYWETNKYPWAEDIRQNNLPKALLKYLCVVDNNEAIIVFENYWEEYRNELAISALTEFYADRFSQELLESILYFAKDLEDNDTLAEALIYYFETWGGGISLDPDVGDAFISICEIELPKKFLEYSWKKIQEEASPAYASDLARCPNLPENIIIELFQYFKQLVDKDVDYYWFQICALHKALSEHPATPADICIALEDWKDNCEDYYED